MDSVTVAAIQHPPVFLNREASIERAVRLIGDAAASGAKLVVFPESWLSGYPAWLDYAPDVARWDHGPSKELFRLLHDSAVEEGHLADIVAATSRHHVSVVLGANEREGSTVYNTMWYCGADGLVLGKHRKLIPTHSERLVWGQGDGSTLTVVDTEFGRVGGLICWEHWMPLARAAMHAQEEFLHAALWPFVKEMHQIASRHYAFEGRTYVIAAGCVLTLSDMVEGCRAAGGSAAAVGLLETLAEEHPVLRGGSAIIAPDGSYLAGPVYDRAETVYASISRRKLIEESMAMDTSGHYARPDVFSLRVDTTKRENVVLESTAGSPATSNND